MGKTWLSPRFHRIDGSDSVVVLDIANRREVKALLYRRHRCSGIGAKDMTLTNTRFPGV